MSANSGDGLTAKPTAASGGRSAPPPSRDTGHSATRHQEHPSTRTGGLFFREWRPAYSPRGAFLLLHGMESHSGWFTETASQLVGDGWAVVAYDRAGWGKSPGQRGHLKSYRDFVEEASLMADTVREKYGSVHLAGMSWGGMAALYLCLRRGWLFDSLTLLAPGLAAKRDITFGGKLRVAADFLRHDGSGMVRPKFKPRHFTSKPEWQQYIATDPDMVRTVSTSFCIETLKMRSFIREKAGRRRIPPTLCLLADSDAIINNPATAELSHRAGARIDVLPATAHSLVFERPGETAARMSSHAAAAAAPKGNVWVVGPGAVGGAVGSLLGFGGRRTSFLVKPSHMEALATNGLTLRSGNAMRSSPAAVSFAGSIAELPPDPELVILAVKSFDTQKALADLAGHIPPHAVIASLQNGLGNEDRIFSVFPQHTVIAASICASLELTGPGKIMWADDRGGMGAALHKGDAEAARRVWNENMQATGMECRWFDGVNAGQRVKWSKLMLNIGFNALNSVTGLSSASLLRDPEYGPPAIQALREGFAVMRSLSLEPIDLPDFPVSKLSLLLRAPSFIARRLMAWQADRSVEGAFSMRQDILLKRQDTEIYELNGKILEIGRRLGFDCLANSKLVELLRNFK